MSLQIFKRLSSTNFTWSILEYVAPYVNICEFLRFIFKRLDQKIVESLPAMISTMILVISSKEVLHLRWNERRLRLHFETLMTLLQI